MSQIPDLTSRLTALQTQRAALLAAAQEVAACADQSHSRLGTWLAQSLNAVSLPVPAVGALAQMDQSQYFGPGKVVAVTATINAELAAAIA